MLRIEGRITRFRGVTKLSRKCCCPGPQQEPGKPRKMEIVTSDAQGTTARIALTGRLDILGAEAIALPLATLAGAKQGLIVDMSGVSFIASIGIRHLVSAAKALSRR